MKPKIIPKQEMVPSFDPNAVVVKYIEYYAPSEVAYNEDEITPKIVSKILKEVSEGINVNLFLDPDGECDWMEVLSDMENGVKAVEFFIRTGELYPGIDWVQE